MVAGSLVGEEKKLDNQFSSDGRQNPPQFTNQMTIIHAFTTPNLKRNTRHESWRHGLGSCVDVDTRTVRNIEFGISISVCSAVYTQAIDGYHA